MFPKILFKAGRGIPKESIARGKNSATHYIFDNAIEPWLIINLVARDRKREGEQEIVFLDPYTLFGIRYASVDSVFNAQTGELVCAGRVYWIWLKDSADSTLPCG